MEERIYLPKYYTDCELKGKSGIYQIKNLVNNKIYIGSSKNFFYRKNEHMRDLKLNRHHNVRLQRSFNKYGKSNFIFEVIEFVSDINNLLKIEQYWIDKFYGRNKCYNDNPKADKPPVFKKKIYCIELKKEFESIQQASDELGLKPSNISAVLKNIHKTCGSYHWVYKEYLDNTSLDKIQEIIKNKKDNFEPIICLDDNKVFYNYKDICREYSIKYAETIRRCCIGKNKTSNGHHFMYLKDYKIATKEDIFNKISYINNKRKVYCITTGETFDSIQEVCEKYKVYNSGVINCCKGIFKSTKGYKFRYLS